MSWPENGAGWSRRTSRVVARFALLGLTYLVAGGVAWATVSLPAYSSTSVRSGTGQQRVVIQSSATFYQEQPGVVRVIVMALAVALIVATGSVVWRVVRRSTRPGVTGIIVAGLVGMGALLGMLTIGVFIAPFAVLLVVLALPIAPERTQAGPQRSGPPPGWYGAATGGGSWHYWDGRGWTARSEPVVAGSEPIDSGR